MLAERARVAEPLHLEPSVLADLARTPGDLTPLRLIKAEQTSAVRRFRKTVGLMARSMPGRYTLDADHQIDWDELPDAYQATTCAHGHLITLKQVFRAAGFSQGDLLYSLPLAPGQQKVVSVLDWNRTDVASRQRRAGRQRRPRGRPDARPRHRRGDQLHAERVAARRVPRRHLGSRRRPRRLHRAGGVRWCRWRLHGRVDGVADLERAA